MSLMKGILRFAVPIPKIESFHRFLFVGPHPDDIEIGAGATVKKLTESGKQVSFLICTDGRFGDGASNGIKGDALAELRKKEAIASAESLGVKDIHFLNLMDGAGYTVEQLEKGIAEIIALVNPDIIFAPDHLSRSESHADHLRVGIATQKVACFAPYSGIMEALYHAETAEVKAIAFYMTARPNSFIKTGGALSYQLSSIFECHKSQYPATSQETANLKLYLKLRSVLYGLRNFSLAAEGFRVLGQVHMHCLPEAGE